MRRITLLTNPDVCNLHCPLCFLNQRGRAFGMGEMPLGIAKAAIEKYGSERDDNGCLKLQEVIPSTMGEPLLYSRFGELLQFCKGRGVPLNLTTNGTFPGKWGCEEGLQLLLSACSDIKVSALASEVFPDWKRNVENLVAVRKKMGQGGTVSLQVTLHRQNLMMIPELIAWATSIGINRIKWNAVVFLSIASQDLREKYDLTQDQVKSLGDYIKGFAAMGDRSIRHEGSLFMDAGLPRMHDVSKVSCSFDEEIWILPDGTEQRCPNPERRFGNEGAAEAKCECCPMARKF